MGGAGSKGRWAGTCSTQEEGVVVGDGSEDSMDEDEVHDEVVRGAGACGTGAGTGGGEEAGGKEPGRAPCTRGRL